MNIIHWSSSAPKQVICGSEINHLMTMVSQRQQCFWSFALNQSHDRKLGGGMMWSRWIRWWSASWIDRGGYDSSLGALNSAKHWSCLLLSCQWICFSPTNMYGSGEPSKSTSSPMAYDLLRAGWDCMVRSWVSGGSWGCWECNWFQRLTCAS